ncbi:MAG: hypothetical protein A3A86_00350 [Elusimicrobia bacterium RIFCSPLOWO2_01_FULL_60_11]|nr:MAG: hypothetical protein A3A86_00350 [Elusimicrobia bacterium RIFCSPLOWO2_01_FULL_60_11]
MKLIRAAVERPVTTAMIYGALVLLGVIVLILLPRELFPSINYPELLVVTRYGSAAPEEIESIITKLVEEQAGTVPNLKRVRSISREGMSVVILEFRSGTDMGMAHLSVREKIDLIKDRLPIESDEPVVQRHNPFARPMMILSISGDLPLYELTRLSNDVVKRRLQKVDGVATAAVSGGQEREILVEVDPGKLVASNISITAVVDALKASNVNYPAGTTQERTFEYLVRTIGEFSSLEDIGRTVISVDAARGSPEAELRAQMEGRSKMLAPKSQRLLPLGNLAVIKDTFKETDSYSRYNGRPNISIGIQKQHEANTVKTAKRVRQALKELSVSLPKGTNLEVTYDESIFISGSLQDVTMDALLGALLAFAVLYFFLGSIQDAIVVTLALPLSIIVVFIFMYFTGRSMNVIALAGLSLGIGSMIDNAIAALDSIVQERKNTPDPKEAAIAGASSIAAAQFFSMLTNITVFFPLLFARGVAQQLFGDLFFAAVISNIAALVIALTLLPRIAAYPYKRSSGTPPGPAAPPSGPARRGGRLGKLWAVFKSGLKEEQVQVLIAKYRIYLNGALSRRGFVLGCSAAALAASLGVLAVKEKIFLPTIDQGQFLVRVDMPVGTRLDVTDRVMGKVEAAMAGMAEIKGTLVRVGSNSEESIEALGAHQAECLVDLDRENFSDSTEKVILLLKKKLEGAALEGASIEFLLQDSSVKSVTGGSAPIAVTVKGPDLDRLREISESMQAKFRRIPGCEGIKTSLALPTFETTVSVDKNRASAFGLSVSDIARASLIGIRGFVATEYKTEGKEIPIRVRIREEDRNNIAAIRRVAVRSPQGFAVPLGDVADIKSGLAPSEIQRIDQQRSVVVTSQILGRSQGDVIADVEKALVPFRALKDYSVELGGTKKEMKESFGGLAIAFLLAVILIYMIMAAGFESLLHPFLIMITVPLGIIGVVFTMAVTFTPISAPVILGVVLLGGIVVNNGIVLVDHMNFLRKEKGLALKEAVLEGCSDRLLPVVMTALTSILSLIPVALGLGQGTAIAAPMALATLGGLLVSTILTMFIMPILYLDVEERRSLKARGAAAKSSGMILD